MSASNSRPKKTKNTLNLKALQQQINELTEALRHERADAINIRRRSEEDRLKMAIFYKSMVLHELLPVLDNLERAIYHRPKELASNQWASGIAAIHNQLKEALVKLGVERIKTVGKPFNPKYHEAVSMEEGEGTQEVVSEELQAGYKIGDEVIRHAVVKVTTK